MKEGSLAQLFVKNLVIAIPWGIIFLLVFLIVSVGVKQQIKEGIQFAVKGGIYEAANFAVDYRTIVPVKQNIKEGVEFVAKTTKDELKKFLNDPQVKKDLKELIE